MISIGEFSKLCMVTTKTLRYYDRIGLLKPYAQSNENSYRYYHAEQLAVMLRISHLKDYGFSLESIKSLLDVDQDRLLSAMSDKAQELEQKLFHDAETLKKINQDILRLKKGDSMKQQNITLAETFDRNIAFVKDTIAIKDFGKLMERLCALELPCDGAPIAIYHCAEFNPDKMEVEVAYPTAVKNDNTRTLSGGLCAKTMHIGDYALLRETYIALGKWIEDNGFQIANPPYEIYLNDPATTPKEKLMTEIFFPVKK